MRVAIYGSRPDGHANVVLNVLSGTLDATVVGLIDDWSENAGRQLGALDVIGASSDLPDLAAQGLEGVLLGFGAAEGRGAVVQTIEAAGLALPTMVHPTAHISSSARLSAGTQVLPLASVGPNATLGRGALVNTGAIVEHDVTVSDYAVIDPGAVLTGRVTIGESVEIGAGAVVLPDVEIGAGTVVGSGAVVTRSVPEGQTVVGVPARRMR